MDALALLGIADHPALELLNSVTDAMGPRLDVLADGEGYLAWLTATGLLGESEAEAEAETESEADAVRGAFSDSELDATAEAARALREEMRTVVAAWSAGQPVPASAVGRLNSLLAEDRRHTIIEVDRGLLTLRETHSWGSAHALLALAATAFADLLSSGDPELVRHCEGFGCTMWFYDRTKGHRRRWCSMAVCGNRAKAAAHRAKQRAT